jgi:surface antigen
VNEYNADFEKTKEWNNLVDINSLYIGQKIILVNGRMPRPPVTIAAQPTNNNYNNSNNYYRPSQPRVWKNHFPWGWCTWWVAQKRYVPWYGNAGWWFYNAQKMGYPVGYYPRVGAIAVWRGGWGGLGHVAYVEWVKPDGSFGISEMNYAGWGRVSYRSFRSVRDSGVYGFIY